MYSSLASSASLLCLLFVFGVLRHLERDEHFAAFHEVSLLVQHSRHHGIGWSANDVLRTETDNREQTGSSWGECSLSPSAG